MFTLEINGKNYPLKFGFAFYLEMNKKEKVEGEDAGVQYMIAKVKDYDVTCLVDVIMTANKTEDDKINRNELIEWLENDDTDIDAVFKAVDGFFSKANCTKNEYAKVQKLAKAMKKAEKLEEA